jgi:hypothetical protein
VIKVEKFKIDDTVVSSKKLADIGIGEKTIMITG